VKWEKTPNLCEIIGHRDRDEWQKVLKRVFEEFDQGRHLYFQKVWGDSGFRFGIVQRLVNVMGGSIEPKGTENLGTTMNVKLQ